MNRLFAVLLFLPALLPTGTAMGQDTTSRVAVVISPALLVPVTVAVQGGLYVRASKRWSVVAEAAVPTFHPTNTDYESIRYWRAGLELRYSLRRKTAVRRYLALQAAYLFRKLTDEGQAFYYTRTQTYSYTNAVINSPVLAPALKVGMELIAGKHVFVDAFLGGGVRFIFTSYKTKSPLLTSLEPKKQTLFTFDDAWLFNYTLKRLHATAGLRLGIRL